MKYKTGFLGLSLLGSVVFSLGGAVSARADSQFNNPFDPTVILFDTARQVAVSQVQALRNCSLKGVSDLQSEKWILANVAYIAQDLAASPYSWFTDLNGTCAVTQNYRNAPISLFHPACQKAATTSYQAAEILIKESVFHQGVFDETVAARVARSIMTADLGCAGGVPAPGGGPFPTPNNPPTLPNDVFNPSICPGSSMTEQQALGYIPLPNQFVRTLGTVAYFYRERYCFTVGGCTDWSKGGKDYITLESDLPRTYILPDYQKGLPSLLLKLVANHPQFSIDVDYYETHWGDRQILTLARNVDGAPIAGLQSGPVILPGLDKSLGFQGKLSNSCLWLIQRGAQNRTDVNGNTFRLDNEFVIYGAF